MSRNFNTVALLGRVEDSRVAESMASLAEHLHANGIVALVEPAAAALVRQTRGVEPPALIELADLAIAIGGDGTMLRAARLAAPAQVPLLGINRGRLGFLADIGPDEMHAIVDTVLAGRFSEEHRLMLRAELAGATEPGLALNDVVLQRGDNGRMLEFDTWIDGVFVNLHGGDGLIVATPTGSTAYALSCGGPIIAPSVAALALVPICPHTLSDRPVVVPAEQVIDVRMSERPEARAQVTCDGVLLGDIAPGQTLRVTVATHHATLLHPPGHDYFKILRSKLRWGRGRSRSTDTTD